MSNDHDPEFGLMGVPHSVACAAYVDKEHFDELYVFTKLNYLVENYPHYILKWLSLNGFEKKVDK